MNDGGPAFPNPNIENADGRQDFGWNGAGMGGMSLRDYFAAKAMTLFLLSEKNVNDLFKGARPGHEIVSRFCYELADAMLKARIEDAAKEKK
jgi:hypothetical protein